jgi:Domain of unknown function (DUF4259)
MSVAFGVAIWYMSLNMGTWGLNNFQNDAVIDWQTELLKHGFAAVREALILPEGYIQIDEAQKAMAAAEVVAAALGKGANDLPNVVSDWLQANVFLLIQEDVVSAAAAVERVRTSSELKEVWEEGSRADLWQRMASELLGRLRGG